ncbi:hypothetical protein [Paludisphaera borealis]|uniref:Uncharacterized protein n=1 Tax=Paludisphaera borealis TaxID=1387353 RepID=A0A1U7CNK2_9BACT|nr:hypothetical protein [Paludisphaera borealis]APW60463.1 hypothetical protein BSF38_01933 [Paludisphaera borealis]
MDFTAHVGDYQAQPKKILIDSCPCCDALAIEQVSCREGRLLQCHECPAAFHPTPNPADATMRTVIWILPNNSLISTATTAGLDARPHGEHGDVSGKHVAIVHPHNCKASFDAVFEARAAVGGGAVEVRVVESSAKFAARELGALFLEWLDSPIYPAVSVEGTVSL